MKNSVFLDTAFIVALSMQTDAQHEKAVLLSEEIEAQGIHLITTRAITLEIGNALSRIAYRKATVDILNSMEQDDNVTILPLTEELYQNALDLYSSRMDKDWGMIDCVSFIVMRQAGITKALTSDRHFEQAGFVPLMR